MFNQEVRDYYNQAIKNKFNQGYEYERWFKDDVRKLSYQMTLSALQHFAKDIDFANYLEIGPGAGTWTDFFFTMNKSANFDLVDISDEMLKMAKQRFGRFGNFRFFLSDFADFVSDRKYDFIFSARAFEYFSDKEKAVNKILTFLQPGGQAFIITKYPKYLRSKLFGKDVKQLHKYQISPADLHKIILRQGGCCIEKYPVVLYFPLFNKAGLNKQVYQILHKYKLNSFIGLFTESYLIKFSKK